MECTWFQKYRTNIRMNEIEWVILFDAKPTGKCFAINYVWIDFVFQVVELSSNEK